MMIDGLRRVLHSVANEDNRSIGALDEPVHQIADACSGYDIQAMHGLIKQE